MSKLLLKAVEFVIAAMMVSGVAMAEPAVWPAFKPMPRNFLNTSGDLIEVTNIHEFLQPAFPICHATAALTAYVQAVCKIEKSDCKKIDPVKTPSMFSLAREGLPLIWTDENGTKVIPWEVGGDQTVALKRIFGMRTSMAESCFPTEQLLQKYSGNRRKMREHFQSLKNSYFDQFKSNGQVCLECLLNTLQNEFDRSISPKQAMKALNESIFDKFLYYVFLEGCSTRVTIPDIDVSAWPVRDSDEQRHYSYAVFIKKAVQVLKTDTPLVTGLCLDKKSASLECKNPHSINFVGYRKSCNESNSNCVDFVKILTGWGQSYQDTISDGWVEAKNLFDYLDHPQSDNSTVMSWVVKPESSSHH